MSVQRKPRKGIRACIGILAGGLLSVAHGAAEDLSAESVQAIQALEQALSAVETDLGGNNSKTGQLRRAQFTHSVKQYEPIDDIDTIERADGVMYFYTELVNLNGNTIKHRWEYNGKVMAEITFPISAALYRVHSSKNIPAYALGLWTVIVSDETGQVLTRKTINVVESQKPRGINEENDLSNRTE